MLAIGLALVLALVVWEGVSPREPRYEGQTYRQWMRGIVQTQSNVVEALISIGQQPGAR